MNRNPFFPRHSFLFKGGGAPSSTTVINNPPPASPVLPKPNVPAPVATASSLETTQAKLDAKKLAANKKGLSSTVLAGASRSSETQPAQKNTLLGGG